jgi:hypothetical protein
MIYFEFSLSQEHKCGKLHGFAHHLICDKTVHLKVYQAMCSLYIVLHFCTNLDLLCHYQNQIGLCWDIPYYLDKLNTCIFSSNTWKMYRIGGKWPAYYPCTWTWNSAQLCKYWKYKVFCILRSKNVHFLFLKFSCFFRYQMKSSITQPLLYVYIYMQRVVLKLVVRLLVVKYGICSSGWISGPGSTPLKTMWWYIISMQ